MVPRVCTFGRLLGFLRPYRLGVVASLVLAALAMSATVAIPWLTGQAVDRIQQDDEDAVRLLAAAVVALAVALLVLALR